MSNQTCILTTKDFTILEVMRDRCLGRDDPLAPILKSKIDSARVTFHDDIPENVATLNSRVTYSIDGRDPDTRVISQDRMHNAPVGMFLPLTTLRGLALLGLTEGHEFVLPRDDGTEDRIVLEKVQYQPEAARREREADKLAAAAPGKPALRLVRGAYHDQEPVRPVTRNGFDDPGPSAA